MTNNILTYDNIRAYKVLGHSELMREEELQGLPFVTHGIIDIENLLQPGLMNGNILYLRLMDNTTRFLIIDDIMEMTSLFDKVVTMWQALSSDTYSENLKRFYVIKNNKQ